MFRLYFGSRSIVVAADYVETLGERQPKVINNPSSDYLANLPFTFEDELSVDTLVILTPNEQSAFMDLTSKLEKISAGGGLVVNNEGECLMIYRQGMWDLPKGKQEPGEEISFSAMREVSEECGVNNLTIDSLICTTYHTYRLNGKFIVKDTNWYLMNYSGNGSTKPQLSEDIEKAVWIKPQELSEYVNETYKSVQDVFLAYLKRKSEQIFSYLKSLI